MPTRDARINLKATKGTEEEKKEEEKSFGAKKKFSFEIVFD